MSRDNNFKIITQLTSWVVIFSKTVKMHSILGLSPHSVGKYNIDKRWDSFSEKEKDKDYIKKGLEERDYLKDT